jgi:hypothetical protein
MDSTIAAAWIAAAIGGLGVISTAMVAISGHRTTVKTNDKAVQAATENTMRALDAAHQAQRWEKQANAYIEAITLIKRRQQERQHMLSPLRYDDATEEKIRNSYADPSVWDWAKAWAELTAYASQPILEAMHAVEEAAVQVNDRVEQWKALTDQARSAVPASPPGEQVMAAHGEVEAAVKAADDTEARLVALIRADLALRPSDGGG